MSIIHNLNNVDDRLKWVFKFYDQNGDGFVERQEFETAISVRMSFFKK